MAKKITSVSSLFSRVKEAGAKNLEQALTGIGSGKDVQDIISATSVQLSILNNGNSDMNELKAAIKDSVDTAVNENIERVRSSIDSIFSSYSFSEEQEKAFVLRIAKFYGIEDSSYQTVYNELDKKLSNSPKEVEVIENLLKLFSMQ